MTSTELLIAAGNEARLPDAFAEKFGFFFGKGCATVTAVNYRRTRPASWKLLSNENCEKINTLLSKLNLLFAFKNTVYMKNCPWRNFLYSVLAEKASVCRKFWQWMALYANNNMFLP